MKRVAVLLLIISVFLSGCNALTGGEHIWTQVHSIPKSPVSSQNIAAADYSQLYTALKQMVEAGTSQLTISVEQYDRDAIEADAQVAIAAVCSREPIAAYAVERIDYTLGTSGGETVLAVEAFYLRDQAQIKKVIAVADNAAAVEAVTQALKAFDAGIVLLVENYEPVYFAQVVTSWAQEYPQFAMETPEVTQNVYPEEGQTRVVELKFTFQTSRDSLNNMLAQVKPMFDAAAMYVSGDGAALEKFSQMYSFLMERYDYKIETSITPAYSLLRHGVGDSKAFATVYAAMCRQAGLECLTVSGTRAGESWYWNMILVEDVYYHVDLMACSEAGRFQESADSEMAGYVWDYDAYPASVRPEPEPTEPTAATTPTE